ncbi:MAG: FHA domain-containing protein [Acidobacteria bacterium]|nr:FHA domain-containing protein [Acidobacteriota bacterium]
MPPACGLPALGRALVLWGMLGGAALLAEPLRIIPVAAAAPAEPQERAKELADRFQESFLLEEKPERIRIEWSDLSCELTWEDWQAFRQGALGTEELAGRMKVARAEAPAPPRPAPPPARSAFVGSPLFLGGVGALLLLGSTLLGVLIWRGRPAPGRPGGPLPPTPPPAGPGVPPPLPTMLMPASPPGPETQVALTPPPSGLGRPVTAGDVLLIPGPGGGTLSVPIGNRMGIGREADNELHLADPAISRHHAVIESFPGGCVLTDLGSANGSRINGRKVEQPTLLRIGDIISLGALSLTVRELEAPPSFPPPPP